jgi:phosphoserine phosphatase
VSTDTRRYTGLILVSGIDSPGITQALFETLAPFAITVLDIEQVVIRERLILTVLIDLNPDHAQAIEEDLTACAERLAVDVATSFQTQEMSSIAAKSGLLHVLAISNGYTAPRVIPLQLLNLLCQAQTRARFVKTLQLSRLIRT